VQDVAPEFALKCNQSDCAINHRIALHEKGGHRSDRRGARRPPVRRPKSMW
jgi:hypothetical protein